MMITISAKQRQGFYRLGMLHTFDAVHHADDRFTAEQLAILQAEPMLSVSVDAEKPKAKTEK
jgi:hypothetical protein